MDAIYVHDKKSIRLSGTLGRGKPILNSIRLEICNGQMGCDSGVNVGVSVVVSYLPLNVMHEELSCEYLLDNNTVVNNFLCKFLDNNTVVNNVLCKFPIGDDVLSVR